MRRRIIRIDREKCTGCGDCARACHEGAIEMADGKAVLTREDYCDGLGDCLPACPAGAISFEEREAPAYDHAAVLAARARTLRRETAAAPAAAAPSRLSQWPVQIQLAPVRAPYLDGAELLVAADCTAYAYGSFHEDFLRGRICLIGCPKLDSADYAGKLGQILAGNDIRSVTVVRMEVPCCGGLEEAVRRAAATCGRDIPWRSVTVSTGGQILEE